MSQLLSVAGGLISVYVIFALIVAHIVELINALFNTRGGTLYAGIHEMLSAKRASGGAAQLGALGRGLADRENAMTTAVSTIGTSLADGIYAHPLIGNLGMKRKPSYIDSRTFTMSLVDSLRTIQPLPGNTMPPIAATSEQLLKDLQERIALLRANNPNDSLARSLGLIVEQAQNRYESALKAIDNWYDAQMQRVSGTFKRYATIWQILIAAIVVASFNVDTLAVVKGLTSSTRISSLVTSTQGLKQLAEPKVPELLGTLKDTVSLGWNDADCAQRQPTNCVVSHLPGLVITWLAVLLGAPFWFDILKQIVPVRLTGTKPDATTAARGDKQSVH